MNNKKYLILNYIFIIGVILLFLNDHYFKWQYSNWITGKLSDFIGILILPFILTYFAPKYLKFNILITGLFFTFWKSELSTDMIIFYNKYSLIKITRTIDYTDLIALTMLPISYLIILKILNNQIKFKLEYQINQKIILFPTILVLMATSPPKSFYYTYSNANLKCFKCGFTVPYSQKEIVNRLKNSDIKFDTIIDFKIKELYNLGKDSLRFYKINTLIIGKDTLKNVDFSMINKGKRKTKIYFNGFNYTKNISDKKNEKRIRKYYKKLIKRYIKGKLK